MHTWFPLSSAQSGIYLHQCKEQGNPLYNIGGYIRLQHPDVARLQRAHARLVRTHEAFRIRVHVADTQDGARQSLIDGDAVGGELPLVDLSAQRDPHAAAQAWIDALFAQCIPLEDAELHRAALLKLSDSVYWYVGMAHHIAVDGMGFVNWAHRLARYHDEDGADAFAPADEPSYAELAARDADYLGSAQYERDRRYWSDQAARFPDSLFASDMMSVADDARRSVRQRMPVTPQLYRKLGELATRLGVEAHAVLLGVLSVYFSQCYSADALVIGIPQHGRQGARERAKIGLFTQMLPLVVELDVHAGMASLLERIGRGQRELLRHRRYPLAGILHQPGNRRPQGQPFDFAYSYVPAGAGLAFATVPAQLVYCSHDHEPHPLLATFWDGGSADSSILLDFNLGRFSAAHIEAFQARLTYLIDQLHEAPDQPLLDLDCVTRQERAALVRQAQHGAMEATVGFDLEGRIAEVVRRYPQRTALECGSARMTYAKLDERIDAIAAALWQDHGVRAGDRVAVLLEHSAELVIVLMALIRLGAVYVPIDTQSPAARTRHILEDCAATLLVSDMAPPLSPAAGLRLVTLVELWNRDGHAARPVSEAVDADAALYVLYTSGSTGLPKGVLIHRRSARNLLAGLLTRLGAVEGGRWLFMSSVGFDISIVEWLGCLGSAGTCVIPSASQLADPFALADLANMAELSLLQSTPSRLKQLRSAGWRPRPGQRVISAGEPLSQELAQDLLACGVVLWNGYGPTEATVYSLVKRVDDAEPADLRVAIGDQLPGYRHYVLNRWQRLIPAGLTGELVIAGAGLAAGYLNRDELTARQFVVPQGVPETRLYRTGDLVRQMGEGCFRYLGRNDDQIKLRGYRIELGEIRSVLLTCPGVRDAAVVHRAAAADRPAHLSAYLCAEAGEDPSTMLEAARAHAKLQLPAYMVPAALTALPALPVNTNGKLDIARLPAAEPQNAEQPLALDSVTERLIASHWSELLGLRLDALGGQSDFFALGGDSVLAVRMVARLRAATGRHIETADLFNHPRLSDLAARVDKLAAWQPGLSSTAANGQAPGPASLVQRQLWLLSQQDPRSARYNMTAGYWLDGEVHVDVLQTALARLVERHHALRTVFRDGDEGLVQVLLPVQGWCLEQVDASTGEEALRVQAATAEHEAFARRPFDLGRDYPFRARLITLGHREAVLLLGVHHIAADGASVEIALREFLADHAAATHGRDAPMPAPVRQFADFAAWQHAMLAGNAWAAQLEYWRDRLAGLPPTHALPAPRSREAGGSAPEAVDTVLARPLVDRLQAYAKRAAATEFSVLQSALALTLCKWSYSDAIVIGSPVSGRTAAEFEGSVGMFVNMLAYPHRFTRGESFADYLARFQRDAARALDHQDVPFEAIVEALQPPREAGRHPLFQVLFAFQDALPGVIDAGGLRLQRLPDPTPVAKYELECLVTRAVDGWSCRWLAAPGVMETDDLHSLANAFASALEQVVCMPDRAMAQVRLASTPSAMGQPARPATVAGVHELISAQARSRPTAVALRWGEQAVSYLELEQRSNRLARLLLQRGVRPGERVALCLPRGALQIVGTLAVLKAGAAYVPVDPGYPPARIAYLLDDAAPACVLATSALPPAVAALLQPHGVLMLDEETLDAALSVLPATAIAATEVGLSPDSDAYVIHTSGSTGQPKGVLIGHRGLINLALAQADAFGIDAHARVLQFASPSFDAAVSEWSTTLSAGAELVLVPEDVVPDAQALTAWAQRYRVTHATLPPTVLRRLSPQAWPTLTHVISAGEAVTLDEARRWATHCRFINAYGPSEATVCATIGGISARSGEVTIGRAMEGLTLYVVDRDLRPLPEGAVGELCIAGVALAKGYLNKPEQTRAAFVDLECDDGRHHRVYRTGDRVRRLADGELAFEGRLDEQVKIRGHRVECGEVEARLAAFPGIREAAVGTRDVPGGDRVLVAYLAADGEFAGDARIEALRQHLLGALPGFMVPSSFVLLDALPLNQSGKVDRKALAARDDVMAAATARRSLTATESIVRDLWVELLGPQADDPDRGFFELGGYSLLVSDALAALRSRFGIAMDYRQFFEHPTIAALAAFIDRQPRALHQEPEVAVAPVLAGGQGGSYPLSFEQQRLWFIDQLEQGSQHYNMPVVLELRGRVEPPLIEAALQRIVARHESLRTTFRTGADGAPVQLVRDDLQLRLEHRRAPRETGAEWTRRLRQQEQDTPFDLADALMLRACLLSVADDEAVLFLTLHHIAADGWSVDRLIAEFGALYGAMLEGREDPLPTLPLQYGQHAAMQRAQALDGGLEAGLQFWRARLQGVPACHSLPLDAPRGATASLRGRAWTSRIPASLAARLAELGRAHDTTLFVVLQSAFAVLVSRWSEHRDIVIGTPIANRHRAELGQLIGFFANTLVLRTDCTRNIPFGTLLRESRAAFLDGFAYQHVPFEMVVEATGTIRTAAHSPLVQLLFSYDESPQAKLASLRVPGLAVKVLDEDGPRPVKFDLELAISGGEDGLACQWLFDTHLFQPQTIERFSDTFTCLLESLLAHPALGIHEHAIVRDAEREALLAPARTLPDALIPGGSICERFERMAQQQPDAVAVIHGERQVTYTELDARARSLASWLVRNGHAAGGPVAIYMARGVELVIALLAVMKSGAAYLPIDLGYPAPRVGFILEDAQVALVLCDDATASRLSGATGAACVCKIDDALKEACAGGQDATDATLQAMPPLDERRHAYVVYTSGSTGQPKGVRVRQDSFLNLVLWYLSDYAFTPADRCLLIGSIGFDMTQKNVFTPLLAGAALVVPDDVFDPAAIAALIDATGVSVINCAPSAAAQLLESPAHWPRLTSLRLLALGGEAIRMSDLRPWLRSPLCRAQLLNMYGPSECTDIAIAGLYSRDAAASHTVTVPIGRPIPNCFAFVLNDQRQLQPRGVVGELYIGGIGVSDGYIDRDDLNLSCFPDDVLPGAGRTYRTGDLVRIDGQGVFHYIGRADHQVKIRGYRVETAEIDALVCRHPRVRHALTLAHADAAGEMSLATCIAFAAPAPDTEAADALFRQIRASLVEQLPAFIVPGRLIRVEAMPLTPNGKIDRATLLAHTRSNPGWRFVRHTREPETETEAALLAIWKELLATDAVGVDDDFFELGGHSLLVTRLASRVARDFDLEDASMSVKEFFQNPTVAAAARVIDARRSYGRLLAKERSLLAMSADLEEGTF